MLVCYGLFGYAVALLIDMMHRPEINILYTRRPPAEEGGEDVIDNDFCLGDEVALSTHCSANTQTATEAQFGKIRTGFRISLKSRNRMSNVVRRLDLRLVS